MNSTTQGPSSPHAGFIFFCSEHTVQECIGLKLFGAPKRLEPAMAGVMPAGRPDDPTILFLFNFHKREMLGIFVATSEAAFGLRPDAFIDSRHCRRGKKEGSSQFPVQIAVERVLDSSFFVRDDTERFEVGPIEAQRLSELLRRMHVDPVTLRGQLSALQDSNALSSEVSFAAAAKQPEKHTTQKADMQRSHAANHSPAGQTLSGPGYLFFCSRKTYQECVTSKLFAMPERHLSEMKGTITPLVTPLFLFDFSKRKMHGVFVAASPPGKDLRPNAFSPAKSGRKGSQKGGGDSSQSPYAAQVEVQQLCKASYTVADSERFKAGALTQQLTDGLLRGCHEEMFPGKSFDTQHLTGSFPQNLAPVMAVPSANGVAAQQRPQARAPGPGQPAPAMAVPSAAIGEAHQQSNPEVRPAVGAPGNHHQQQPQPYHSPRVGVPAIGRPSVMAVPSPHTEQQHQQPDGTHGAPPTALVAVPSAARPPSPHQKISQDVAFRVVMVDYIPVGSMKAEVQEVFEPVGEIEMLKLIVRPKQKFGYCFLRFKFAQAAARAITELNNYEFRGSRLQVNYADKSVEQPGAESWRNEVEQWTSSTRLDCSSQTDDALGDEFACTSPDFVCGARDAAVGMELSVGQPLEPLEPLSSLDCVEIGAALESSDCATPVKDQQSDEAMAAALAYRFCHAALELAENNPSVFSHELLEAQMLSETTPAPEDDEKMLPTIVIDGANVARHHNPFESGFLNMGPIHSVLDYWLSRGHRCIALLPDFWFDPARQARNDLYTPGAVLLRQLQEMGLVAPVPEDNVIQAAKLRAEPPIIQYSKEHGGVIVTLDTFGDVVRQKPDEEAREVLRAWIRMFTMPYNFVGDTYVPQDDFVMPSLKTHRLVSGEQPPDREVHPVASQRLESPTGTASKVFDDEEVPPVAAFRRHAMLEVMKSICTVESGTTRQNSRFLTRKVAADVFNKWVFQTHATGSSRADNSDGNEGWTRAQKPLDAVIPSCGNSNLTQYIERQLVSGYDVSSDAAATAAAQLSQQCSEAAQKVHQFAQTQRRWWAHKNISDASMGVEASTVPDSENDLDPIIQITWRGSSHSDQQSEHCQLWKSHFDALKRKYIRGGHDRSRMLSRIFVMVLRYETLSEVKSAYQAALPKQVLQVMQDYFGVRCECFASPLNCYCDNFCSLFPDTDGYFGSRGSFFDCSPSMGSFECNPPFDQMSVLNTFTHILKLLHDSEQFDQPLSFIVTTAQMDFNVHFAHLEEDWQRFCTKKLVVPRTEHSYMMGLQHRRTGESRYWNPSRDSTVYFLQNQAGAAMWPATAEKIQLILDAWQTS